MATVVAAIQVGGTIAASGHSHGEAGCWWAASCSLPRHLDALAFVLLACGPLALALWRLHPRRALALIFAATLVYVAFGYPQGPVYASPALAFVRTATAGDRLAAVVALIASWSLFPWLPVVLGTQRAPKPASVLALAAWLLVAFAAAEALRGRRERAGQERRRREQEARLKAEEERLQIARELHDVLAHSISMINVQSGVALHLMDERPEQARTALEAINEASADALREVRAVLGALRSSGAAGGDGDGRHGEPAPRAPVAGMARLDELVSRARAAGVQVSIRTDGEPGSLPASVDLAAFRIVQESLTNVVRHAHAGHADVRVTYGKQMLTLQVDDDGCGGAANGDGGGGNGIPGMRERAAALGGRLEAGPRPGGGYRVRAELPWRWAQ
jgi:signal transduction histidine kinase